MEEIIQKVRDACAKRGITGLSKLGKEFGRLDDDDNRSLSLEKLTEGLRNFQAGLTNEEATMLFNEIDKDEKGGIDYEAFLALIRGNENSLSPGCLEVVKQAFDKMDTCKDGVLKSEDIAKYYSADEGTSFDAYLARFDSDAKGGPVEITREEFIEYYTKQRNNFYKDDDYFITSLKRSFKL
nr:troponin C, skeletal muscle-like [Pocillopora verrucosa]